MTDRRKPRNTFLESLDESQTVALSRLIELLGRHNRTLATYYECAQLIVALQPAEAGYGSSWVRELCWELDRRERPVSSSLAYRLIRFAEAFSGARGADQVRKLDGRVSWESMFRIIAVEDAGKREAILQRTAEEGLSSRAVMQLIREKAGYRRARGGRAAPRPSNHPNWALRELRILVSKWPTVYVAWSGNGNPALKRADRLKGKAISDAFLADLEAVIPLVEEMAKGAGELAGDLSDLLSALRQKQGEPGSGK